MVRRKHIRALADQLLTQSEVTSAPVPVFGLAKVCGADLSFESTDDDLSGFLYRKSGRARAVIGVNADHHPNRQRFTVAHELGHLLLHDLGDVHVDRQFKIWLRSESSKQGVDLEEREANLFAAEILMPAKMLSRDVDSIGVVDLVSERTIQKLAEEYGVSTQAMTFRLAYLGYVQQ